MIAFKKTGFILLASTFVLALAIDTADARRGGGAGVRAGGGGGMRVSAGGVRGGFAGRAHVSRPIAGAGRIAANRPGLGGAWAGNRPGWNGGWAGNRPGYGYGYRPGYGWGAAAVAGAVGAGLAYSNCYDGYCGGYGGYGGYERRV